MLFQQGTQRIEIIVRKDSGGQQNANEVGAEEVGGKEKTWRTSVFGTESKRRINRIVKTNATHAFAVMKQGASIVANYVISGIGYRTGDQAYQESWNREIEKLKDVGGFASSVAMGATYGAWGGPIGAVMGATLGGIQSGVSLLTKYAGRERELSIKQFKEMNSIQYQRARANINLTTGRLR